MDNNEVIARIRARVKQLRHIARIAHDPKMIEMLLSIVEQQETDIRRLETERDD